MIEQLRKELEVDEGCILEIYLDHLGYKTVGIGHLCGEGQPEYSMEVGDAVSRDRVNELFEKDITWTLTDCRQVISEFEDLPTEVKLILANMVFNMGLSRMLGFKKFIAAVHSKDWKTAAAEMLDSRWNKQVPARSYRLVKRMENVE